MHELASQRGIPVTVWCIRALVAMQPTRRWRPCCRRCVIGSPPVIHWNRIAYLQLHFWDRNCFFLTLFRRAFFEFDLLAGSGLNGYQSGANIAEKIWSQPGRVGVYYAHSGKTEIPDSGEFPCPRAKRSFG